jgi:hypothetical protein
MPYSDAPTVMTSVSAAAAATPIDRDAARAIRLLYCPAGLYFNHITASRAGDGRSARAAGRRYAWRKRARRY